MQGSDGITWSVEGSALNNATPVTVVTDGTYALQTLQHLVLAVPDTLAAGAVSNSILYTVTPI
jgi:hypothetical protein